MNICLVGAESRGGLYNGEPYSGSHVFADGKFSEWQENNARRIFPKMHSVQIYNFGGYIYIYMCVFLLLI